VEALLPIAPTLAMDLNSQTDDQHLSQASAPIERLSNDRLTDVPAGTKNPPILVAYSRVSTRQQGQSGLGLEAQQAAVASHVAETRATLIAEYTEIESGTHSQRPQLTAALARCRETGAILVIAKLDRLARNVAFLSALMDGDVEFRALDLPGASRFHLHIMAAVAEQEALAISQRTKAALQAAKARGVVLGHPANLTDASRRASILSRQAKVAARNQLIIPLIRAWRRARWSFQRIASELRTLNVTLPRGGSAWQPAQVRRVLNVARRPRARRRGTRPRAQEPAA
jgi:DNA invertase Pin-like site-specific DNA recombinase